MLTRVEPGNPGRLGMNGLTSDRDAPGSPLETSIGQLETGMGILNRGRAVSPDFEARARAGSRTPVKALPSKASSPVAPDSTGLSALVSTSTTSRVTGAGAPLRCDDNPEALVGDKGETASEVAAMFANW